MSLSDLQMLQQSTSHSDTAIGLIVPKSFASIHMDAHRMYPNGTFMASHIELPAFDYEDNSLVIARITNAAMELVSEGVRAISLAGPLLRSYGDGRFLDDLQEKMKRSTGVPCTSLSYGVIRALSALNMSRVAVVSTYCGATNIGLAQLLATNHVTVTAAKALRLAGLNDTPPMSRQGLVEACARVWQDAELSHGILIAGAGLTTLDAMAEIEHRLGVPVVSTSSAACWDVVRTAKLNWQANASFRLGQIK